MFKFEKAKKPNRWSPLTAAHGKGIVVFLDQRETHPRVVLDNVPNSGYITVLMPDGHTKRTDRNLYWVDNENRYTVTLEPND